MPKQLFTFGANQELVDSLDKLGARFSITVDQLLGSKKTQIPAKVYFNADILTAGEDANFDQFWEQAHDARIGNTPVKVASIGTLLLLLSQSDQPKHVQDAALLKQITG
mgnify:CR=1 FL=1